MSQQKKSPFKRINKIHDEIASYIKKIDKLIEEKKFTSDDYLVMVDGELSDLNKNEYFGLRYKGIKKNGNKKKYGPRWYEQILLIGRWISAARSINVGEYYGSMSFLRLNGEIFERYQSKGGLIFLPLNFLCLGTLVYPIYIQRLLGGRDSLKLIYETYTNPANFASFQINNIDPTI